MSSRIESEKKVVAIMAGIYCRGLHGARPRRAGLCAECAGLLAYAHAQLDGCPFGEQKTTCANCPVHCYAPERREQIRTVMRYAGPRMTFTHPILAVAHLVMDLRERHGR